jgi:small subunit ribosomal protein S4e
LGKKGGKKHLKRKPAPKFWPIHRKKFVWAPKPKPGPHPISRCIPLVLIVRDLLGFAKTEKEAKTIVSQGKIEVDGKIQREELFPVGLMDVVSIPSIEKAYRVLPSEKGLILHQIGKEEMGFKLCRIENKTNVNGGHVQLNLHDGRNLLIRVKDPKKPEEDVYKTLDTLKISLPNQEVAGHIKLVEGAPVIIIQGKNIGRYGKIVAIEEKMGQKRRNALVIIEDANGNRFQTTLDFVFALGDAQSLISLPEASPIA